MQRATLDTNEPTPPDPAIAKLTQDLADYAIAGRSVCITSRRPSGVVLVAIGRVVLVTERIAIISRRRRDQRGEGETYVKLACVTKVEPAPEVQP